MRDKIISFLLAIITLGIMAVISVMGYMIYKEITGQSIIPEDFVGEIKYILGEETINQNTTIIQENSFDGVDGQKINKITKYKHLYDQLDSTAKTIYDKLYENRENLKIGTYTVDFENHQFTYTNYSSKYVYNWVGDTGVFGSSCIYDFNTDQASADCEDSVKEMIQNVKLYFQMELYYCGLSLDDLLSN